MRCRRRHRSNGDFLHVPPLQIICRRRRSPSYKKSSARQAVFSLTGAARLKAHQLPGFRIGSDWRFNIEDIDRWRVVAERAPERPGS